MPWDGPRTGHAKSNSAAGCTYDGSAIGSELNRLDQGFRHCLDDFSTRAFIHGPPLYFVHLQAVRDVYFGIGILPHYRFDLRLLRWENR